MCWRPGASLSGLLREVDLVTEALRNTRDDLVSLVKLSVRYTLQDIQDGKLRQSVAYKACSGFDHLEGVEAGETPGFSPTGRDAHSLNAAHSLPGVAHNRAGRNCFHLHTMVVCARGASVTGAYSAIFRC